MSKATYKSIDKQYLAGRAKRTIQAGYSKPRWIEFCEKLISDGYKIKLYEARKTFSKYVYVNHNDKTFKVRFSNHKPSYMKEKMEDCDYFVGVTNTGVRTTKDALIAVSKFFKGGDV